jgi:hypothetical protein
MSHAAVVVQGTVNADGTLELAEKLNVPAGRVRVVIEPLPDASGDSLIQTLEAIWAGQRARGFVPRTVEEIEAERRAFRGEMEEELQAAMRLQEECRQARKETLERAESGE